jgi:hypothetical protein
MKKRKFDSVWDAIEPSRPCSINIGHDGWVSEGPALRRRADFRFTGSC